MKQWLEETSDCMNNRQEDSVREKKSLEARWLPDKEPVIQPQLQFIF